MTNMQRLPVTERLIQRAPDGYPVGADRILREAYGPIPDTKLFQHNYGYEIPMCVFGWDWSHTFHRWSALVMFYDGWQGWTWPLTL